MTSNEDSPLLKLPAELRNAIYSLALEPPVDDRPITIINRSRSPHPDLLGVCRQIREEALKVYYSESHFWVEQEGFSGDTDRVFTTLLWRYNPTASVTVDIVGSIVPNWSSIFRYLEDVHYGRANGLELPVEGLEDAHADLKVLWGTFNLVRFTANLDWDYVAAMLNTQRAVLGMMDERWLYD